MNVNVSIRTFFLADVSENVILASEIVPHVAVSVAENDAILGRQIIGCPVVRLTRRPIGEGAERVSRRVPKESIDGLVGARSPEWFIIDACAQMSYSRKLV